MGLIHSGRGRVERVKARRKTSSAGTGEEGRGGDKSGKLRCVWDGCLGLDVEEPQNILNPTGQHFSNIPLKQGISASAFLARQFFVMRAVLCSVGAQGHPWPPPTRC